jgi:hypothetical protein
MNSGMMTERRERMSVRKVSRVSCRSTPAHDSRGQGRRNEKGSSLILALVYIVAISLIVGGLTDWAMNDLSNTTHFQSATTIQNAVSGATETAIQSIRYYPEYPSATYKYACFSPPAGDTASVVSINNTWVAVWCSTVSTPTAPISRTVTFYACPESSPTVSVTGTPFTNCETTPYLKAVVNFGDYPSGGGGLNENVCSGGTSFCGFSATTVQWTWE